MAGPESRTVSALESSSSKSSGLTFSGIADFLTAAIVFIVPRRERKLFTWRIPLQASGFNDFVIVRKELKRLVPGYADIASWIISKTIFDPTLARRGVQCTLSKVQAKKEAIELNSLARRYEKEGNEKRGREGGLGKDKRKRTPEEGYVEKFRRAQHECASMWVWTSLNNVQNLLKDSIVKSEILKSFGEHPQVPEVCNVCNKQLTTEPEPSEDHGVNCASKRNSGINQLAGGLVESAVTHAVRHVEDCGATRHPDLDEIPGFERTSAEGKAKTYGDILTSHNGRQVIIDVRFSSRTDMTVSQLEEDKTSEYKRNRNFDAIGFIPFIVTSNGSWGDQMTKYFKETETGRKGDNIIDEYHRKYVRYAKELVSLAVCKANELYIHRMRYGVTRNPEAQETNAVTRTSTVVDIVIGSEFIIVSLLEYKVLT